MNKTITIPISEMIPAGSTLTLTFSKEGNANVFPIGVTNSQISIANAEIASLDSNTALGEEMSKIQNLPFKEDSILQSIFNDGYVKNTKFYRRWVMAQYLRALQSPNGYYGYINNMSYMDSFDKMVEEVKVLSKLETSGNVEAFNERKSFFTIDVVKQIIKDYLYEVDKYIKNLPQHNCRGEKYIKISGKGNVFVKELKTVIINPLMIQCDYINSKETYKDIYNVLRNFKRTMIKLPDYTHKSKAWRNAYQASGAYYTLKNMIMYHNCILPVYENGDKCTGMVAVQQLKSFIGKYKGFQFHALLKSTIELNKFNFEQRMEELKAQK